MNQLDQLKKKKKRIDTLRFTFGILIFLCLSYILFVFAAYWLAQHCNLSLPSIEIFHDLDEGFAKLKKLLELLWKK